EQPIIQVGSDMAFSSRDEGFRWPVLETVLRWSGIISRYEQANVITRRETILALVCVGLAILIAFLVVVRLLRSQPLLAAMWGAMGGIPAMSLLVGHNYVAEKTSLYIGFPVALGVLGAAAAAWQSKARPVRALSALVLVPVVGVLVLSLRLNGWYWALA